MGYYDAHEEITSVSQLRKKSKRDLEIMARDMGLTTWAGITKTELVELVAGAMGFEV